MDHPPAFLRARHLAERQVDPALHCLGHAVQHRHIGLRHLLLLERPLEALVRLGVASEEEAARRVAVEAVAGEGVAAEDRSEERRGGKESGSWGRSRGWPYH